jgi:hypothetical protein
MQCKFVDEKTKVRCNIVADNFCENHINSLQSRMYESRILNINNVDYVLKNNMVCAYMDTIKNLPLTKCHVEQLKARNINIHPSVKKLFED